VVSPGKPGAPLTVLNVHPDCKSSSKKEKPSDKVDPDGHEVERVFPELRKMAFTVGAICGIEIILTNLSNNPVI
jgi:hypothetical protein